MGRYASGSILKRGQSYAAKASGAETSSTTGALAEVGDAGSVYVKVDVTAVSGTTPTMTVVVEGSDDGVTYFTIATIGANGATLGAAGGAPTNITANVTVRACVPAMQYMRSRSVIGGTTPSFTYSVTLEGNIPSL